MEHCIQNGEDKMAINDCPTNVKNLHLFIKELDKNSEVGTDFIVNKTLEFGDIFLSK